MPDRSPPRPADRFLRWAAAAALGLLALFVAIESRTRQPILRLGILRNGALVRPKPTAPWRPCACCWPRIIPSTSGSCS